jgi:hypothetical protein
VAGRGLSFAADAFEAAAHALAEHVALELGEGGEHRRERPPARRRHVERLRQRYERDAERREVLCARRATTAAKRASQ